MPLTAEEELANLRKTFYKAAELYSKSQNGMEAWKLLYEAFRDQVTCDLSLIQSVRQAVEEWNNKQGHDKCHYYPEIFRKILDLLGIPENKNVELSEAEFQSGCDIFRKDLLFTKAVLPEK